MTHRIAPAALAAVAALTITAAASAHAKVSPAVAAAKDSEVFTLAVPTEKAGATTTAIEFTPPSGFGIDSFFPSPGWKRSAVTKGSGEDAVIEKVKWTGGAVPTDEDAAFSFLASPAKTGTYTFAVKQTYSDGTVVNWSGPESSDTPSPTIKAVSSLGGGGTSTLDIVALALGAIALVVAVGGLLTRSGRSLA
jgi:uncharacterized protein YcnI